MNPLFIISTWMASWPTLLSSFTRTLAGLMWCVCPPPPPPAHSSPSEMHHQLNFSYHLSDHVIPCLEPSMASFSLHVEWICKPSLCSTKPSMIYLLSISPTARWFQPHGPSLWAHQTHSTRETLNMLFCLPRTLVSRSISHVTSWAFFNSLSNHCLLSYHLLLFLDTVSIWNNLTCLFSLFSFHTLALWELLPWLSWSLLSFIPNLLTNI